VNHLEVLKEVRRRGLRLTAEGQNLRLQGPQQRVDAALVAELKANKPELLACLTADSGFGLTLLQRGFLIGRGDAVEMGNVASHIYHEIDGCWDLDKLQEALRQVVARHGMLRTRFTADGRQVTSPSVDVALGRLDLRELPAAQQQARLNELREQRSHRILPADHAPLLAADVTLLADDRMRLHVGHDGLVMDGISMFALFDQWHAAYAGAGDDTEGDDTEEVNFADYVAAQDQVRASAAGQRSRDWWLARLDDLPPHPDLPLRSSPAAIAKPRFTQHTVRLDPAKWNALRQRAASAKVTPTVALLTAYAQVLARWGAGRRFTLATTVAARPPIHPRIAQAIGNFSQTMLVQICLERGATLTAQAQAIQAQLRTDLDHRHFSGVEVLRELTRRDPAADARMPYTFNSAIGHQGPDGSALELFGPEVYTSSQTPQVWLNAFAFEQHGGVIVQFDEVTGLFPDGLIAAMVGAYSELLTGMADAGTWAATQFDLLPADQQARRRAANDTTGPLPEQLLPEAFATLAARTPDAPAVLTASVTISYGELFAAANGAANWLRARQVAPDELVGLVMRRGPEQITGIMATLMAGGAYLPVDAALPAERIAYMLRDGAVRRVLTNTGWRSDDDTIEVLDLPGPRDEGGTWTPVNGAAPEDLAYVLYTSGTTGEPKGVMVSHRSVANVVADCNDRFKIGPADRFMGISAFNFDLSAYDVFGALSAGAALVLPDADRAADPAHWLELCGKFDITVWNSVPAIARLLAEQAHPGDLQTLRLVMMSGDRIPATLPDALRRVMPDAELVSLGGPTETTIWNVWHPIGDTVGERIPYGRPNANNRAYILDEDGMQAPDWVTGEICAAGAGLARGYWGDQARTDARFYHDERLGERIYRTGDLGRYLPDGAIDILGRRDFQIKVNGYRIEAGEVETRLTAITGIRQAVVVRQGGTTGDRLVAHLVAADDHPADEEVRTALATQLPSYMVPAVIVWHQSLPLTRNGKVDRAALAATRAAAPTRSARHTDVALGTLGEIWAQVLKVPAADIGPDTDFYDIGGDSLAAARIFTVVRKRFGVGITLDQLHRVRTLESMAAVIDEGAS
jgi:pyochelin synthetase